MTFVAGLVEPLSNTAILVADSRVTDRHDGHFDVCQKVALLGSHGLFEFAGPIKEAANTANWITGTFNKLVPSWLTDEADVIGMLHTIGAYGQSEPNSFMDAFMDERNHATLLRFLTNGDYAITRFGMDMIGSGSESYQEVRPELTNIVTFGGLGKGGIASAHRALLMSQMIMDVARELSITSVGGLMQIHFVEEGGIRAVPYERWVDISEHHGTYVKMDIDADGAWVQIHEPSELKMPLRYPDELDFGIGTVISSSKNT